MNHPNQLNQELDHLAGQDMNHRLKLAAYPEKRRPKEPAEDRFETYHSREREVGLSEQHPKEQAAAFLLLLLPTVLEVERVPHLHRWPLEMRPMMLLQLEVI
jgi:hypothetical protein